MGKRKLTEFTLLCSIWGWPNPTGVVTVQHLRLTNPTGVRWELPKNDVDCLTWGLSRPSVSLSYSFIQFVTSVNRNDVHLCTWLLHGCWGFSHACTAALYQLSHLPLLFFSPNFMAFIDTEDNKCFEDGCFISFSWKDLDNVKLKVLIWPQSQELMIPELSYPSIALLVLYYKSPMLSVNGHSSKKAINVSQFWLS